MQAGLRRAVQAGVVLAIVLAFVVLIGLEIVLARMLAGALPGGARIGAVTGMVAYLALVSLWLGWRVGGRHATDPWPVALACALAAGASAGLLYGGFVQVLALVRATGSDVRPYLYQLSPANIDALQLGLDPPGGAVATALVLAAGALGSTVMARLLGRGRLRAVVARTATRSVELRSLPFVGTVLDRRPARLLAASLVAALLLAMPQGLSEYWNSTLGTVGIYLLMGLGLNIVVGLAGLLDLGYVAFFAVGAYTMGLLTAPRPLGVELGFWTVLPLSIGVAALAGVLLGLPVLRLRGDYLAIVTLGFGEIIRVLVMSQALAPVLGGPQGIRDIGGPALLGQDLTSQRAYVYLMLVGILAVIGLTMRLQHSRLGRSWVAMREDETVARATGINVYQAKLLAFAFGAAFAGFGGAIFAARNQYTGPEDHVLMVSINVLCLVIVGGMGSVPGIVAGAFVLKGLPEVLRPLQDYRLLAFGGLLVAMMVLRPQGILPSRRRRLELAGVDETEPVESRTGAGCA